MSYLRLILLLHLLLPVVTRTVAPDFRPAAKSGSALVQSAPEYYTSANTVTNYRQVLCDLSSPSCLTRQAAKLVLPLESRISKCDIFQK